MVQARIRIELSEGQWKADVSRGYDDLSLQLLSMVRSGDRAAETVVVSGCDPDGCLPEMESHPDIAQFDVVEQHRNSVTVQLETCEPALLSSTAAARTPLVYPAEVNCGQLTATIVGTHETISSLGKQLRADGFNFEVASIQSGHDVNQILTDRQAEVLFTAVDHGYYRSPRECTLTEVAEILGIAKSTCSETLQRAEEAVIEYFCIREKPPGQGAAGTRSTLVSEHAGD